MPYPTLGHRLPAPLAVPLFGDRARWGRVAWRQDPHWVEWEATYTRFYEGNQKQSVGKVVNDAGYTVMARVDLEGRRVLEVGPGDIQHLRHWRGRPARYVIADIHEDMLQKTGARLAAAGVPWEGHRVDPGPGLPFDDASFDVVVSFYAFEHLHPFDAHLAEILRVLRPGGRVVGGVPCEGGLAWGLGRLLTTRRWLRRHTGVDPDKIICWEHPNFAGEVLAALDAALVQQHLSFWPLGVPSVDLNLIARFVHAKR